MISREGNNNSFLPSHYNDVHAFVSSTEDGFFRILGVMSLRGQENIFPIFYVIENCIELCFSYTM